MHLENRVLPGWLAALLIGNALAVSAMGLWFPGAGFDPFNSQHVRLVVMTGAAAAEAIALSIAGLIFRRRCSVLMVTVAAVQMLGVVPAVLAPGVWPGGDDGPKIGWTGIVVPLMAILALVAAIACVHAIAGGVRRNSSIRS
jgi:NADH:ubiquinone oxidoreductase subunit K